MARPQKNQIAQRQLHTNLKRLQRTNPASVRDIERWGWLHGLDVGNQSVRNALNGEIDPTACALELLLLLTGFYGVAPAELGSFTEQRINAVLQLVGSGSSGPEGGHHQQSDGFGWLEETRGQGHIALVAQDDTD